MLPAARGGAATCGRASRGDRTRTSGLGRPPHVCMHTHVPRFRRHRRGHHVLRHRCERSTASPTERTARKRAAAPAVAGEGVTQTGAEAPSPEHLVGLGPHLLRRTPYARPEQGTQLHTGKPTRASICTTNAWASRTRATVGELSHRKRLYCAVTAFNRCSRTVVRAICTLRKHARLCACFRAQDTTQGDTGVVEPGARAAGAKGIERCPPHVYP